MDDTQKIEAMCMASVRTGADQLLVAPDEQAAKDAFAQMVQVMCGMADMMRTTNERMGQLEKQVLLLNKVTPAQAGMINTLIRERAKALCAAYRADGQERAAANAIRREIKLTHGVQNMRDLPRVEYAVVKKQVELWDDYKTMKAIKGREGSRK